MLEKIGDLLAIANDACDRIDGYTTYSQLIVHDAMKTLRDELEPFEEVWKETAVMEHAEGYAEGYYDGREAVRDLVDALISRIETFISDEQSDFESDCEGLDP